MKDTETGAKILTKKKILKSIEIMKHLFEKLSVQTQELF